MHTYAYAVPVVKSPTPWSANSDFIGQWSAKQGNNAFDRICLLASQHSHTRRGDLVPCTQGDGRTRLL